MFTKKTLKTLKIASRGPVAGGVKKKIAHIFAFFYSGAHAKF
jgi:hypothetical protein